MDKDLFPCGLVITDFSARTITYANTHLGTMTGLDVTTLLNTKLDTLLTKSSVIFLDSYIYPLLLKDGMHSEVRLSLVTEGDRELPVIANVALIDNKRLYWSIMPCLYQNKLYDELLAAKELLERQAVELEKLALKDALTGIPNRRAALEAFPKLIAHSKRKQSVLSVMMIDIDHFKNINDTLGHPEGDRILCELGQKLEQSIRAMDIVARWGGEEFLVVLYDVGAEQSQVFCDRVHEGANSILYSGEPLSISIGISELANFDADPEVLIEESIKKADEALYQAKLEGKNRTVIYKPKT
jgi:diguanylate cyclase (GGDEF)-like protein